MTEDEMIGWPHRFDEHEFGQHLGDSEAQGSLRAAVHGAAKGRTRLSDWKTTNYYSHCTNEKNEVWGIWGTCPRSMPKPLSSEVGIQTQVS